MRMEMKCLMMALKRGKNNADQNRIYIKVVEDRGNKCPRRNKRRYNKDIVFVE